MPRIRLLRNLGKSFAERLELDPLTAKEGAIVAIEGDGYDELVKRSLCVDAGAEPEPAPASAPEEPTSRRGRNSQ